MLLPSSHGLELDNQGLTKLPKTAIGHVTHMHSNVKQLNSNAVIRYSYLGIP